MSTECVLASNNDHKLAEFRRLLPQVRILLPQEIGVSFDFEEDGATFYDNARGKAFALLEDAGRPVLADDSGLCVHALGGAPGILSNRYGAGPDGKSLETPGGTRSSWRSSKGKKTEPLSSFAALFFSWTRNDSSLSRRPSTASSRKSRAEETGSAMTLFSSCPGSARRLPSFRTPGRTSSLTGAGQRVGSPPVFWWTSDGGLIYSTGERIKGWI